MKPRIILLLLIALAVVSTGIATRSTRGQAVGIAHMANPKVTQGDSITMDVTLDKAPSLDGRVFVTALPDGATNGGVTLVCGLGSGQTTCTVGATMPLEAKLGKWTISEITFAPNSGAQKMLSAHGDSSFEVVAHGPIVLPDSGTVSKIK